MQDLTQQFCTSGNSSSIMAQSCLRNIIFLLLAIFSPTSAWATEEEPVCNSIEACVRYARTIAAPSDESYNQLNTQERTVAERLVAFGSEAVPALIEMLNDPKIEISQIAGYALRGMEGIDEKYLPDLDRAMQRDDGWIPPAFGRIGTPEAARLLVEQLIRQPEVDNQLEYALRLTGPTAVPFLMDLMRCERGCSEKLQYAVIEIFREIGDSAAPAIDDLLANASDEQLSLGVRAWNVRCLAAIGPAAISTDQRLLELADKSPELRDVVDAALFSIQSPAVGQVAARRLREEPSLIMLRDLAETREAGRGAGLAVVSLLTDPDWQLRVAAARTLGFIGYTEGAQALEPLLDNEENWQLAWAAAQSLGRLQVEWAIPALERASRSHWFSVVRNEAATAIEKIRNKEGYLLEFHPDNFPLEFFTWKIEVGDVAACEQPVLEKVPEAADQKLYRGYADKKLQRLSYQVEYLDYEALSRGIERMKMVERTPDLALRVDSGWLLGMDRGEWGGELVFRSDSGKSQVILNENIEDIYQLGDRYVTVTGLAHLTFNHGHVFLLKRLNGNQWKAENWRQLPGAPRSSWFVETGELLVNSHGGASVLIAPDGTMRMAPCASVTG